MSTFGSSLSKPEDGTALINPSVLNQLAGIPKDLSRAAFDAAVTQERANITNNGTGVWNNGEKISIFGELGTRIWFVGGSAAASHARNVSYQGKTYALAADANTFGSTTGAPTAGNGTTTNDGNYVVDAAAGLVYGPKATNWPAGVAAAVTIVPNTASLRAVDNARGAGANVPSAGSGILIPANYARTKAKLAAVFAGTGSMKIGRLGDSTEVGVSASGAAVTGNRAISPTPYFTAALNCVNCPAVNGSFWGSQNVQLNGTLPAYDPRITLSTNWGIGATNAKSLGGPVLLNSADTGAATFLPTEPVDTFDIYFARGPSTGQFTVSRTGDTTTGTIDSSGTAAVFKYTFTGALGNVNPVSIQRVSGGGIYLIGVDAYNSAKPSVRAFNWGWYSGLVSNWTDTTNPYSHLPTMASVAPDLTFIAPFINEWTNTVTVSAAQANLETLVTAALVYSDVILTTPFPSQNTSTTLAVQKTYVDAIFAVAANHGLMVNDLWGKLGSWEQANAFGYYANSLHPNQTLYKLKGEAEARIVLALA